MKQVVGVELADDGFSRAVCVAIAGRADRALHDEGAADGAVERHRRAVSAQHGGRAAQRDVARHRRRDVNAIAVVARERDGTAELQVADQAGLQRDARRIVTLDDDRAGAVLDDIAGKDARTHQADAVAARALGERAVEVAVGRGDAGRRLVVVCGGVVLGQADRQRVGHRAGIAGADLDPGGVVQTDRRQRAGVGDLVVAVQQDERAGPGGRLDRARGVDLDVVGRTGGRAGRGRGGDPLDAGRVDDGLSISAERHGQERSGCDCRDQDLALHYERHLGEKPDPRLRHVAAKLRCFRQRRAS